MFEGIRDWFSNAYDTVTNWGGNDEPMSYNPSGDPQSDVGQSVLSDLDIDNSGSIDDRAISSYQPGYDYSSYDNDYGDFIGNPAQNNPSNGGPNGGKGFLGSLLSPSVLGAAITSGAGLLGGLSAMDAQKQQLAAAKEQQKMNQLLELAKLKYQLMGKGAGTGGRRSGAGGASGPTPQQINAQASQQLSSGYQNLGGNLASIYRS